MIRLHNLEDIKLGAMYYLVDVDGKQEFLVQAVNLHQNHDEEYKIDIKYEGSEYEIHQSELVEIYTMHEIDEINDPEYFL